MLGGVEYRMSPLTDRDISELDEWIQTEHIRLARASLGPECTQAERDETLGIAMRQARTLSWMSPEGAAIMGTVDGVARVIFQGLRENHPELVEKKVPHARVRQLLLDPRTVEYAMTVWNKINLEGIKKGPPQRRSAPRKTK